MPVKRRLIAAASRRSEVRLTFACEGYFPAAGAVVAGAGGDFDAFAARWQFPGGWCRGVKYPSPGGAEWCGRFPAAKWPVSAPGGCHSRGYEWPGPRRVPVEHSSGSRRRPRVSPVPGRPHARVRRPSRAVTGIFCPDWALIPGIYQRIQSMRRIGGSAIVPPGSC